MMNIRRPATYMYVILSMMLLLLGACSNADNGTPQDANNAAPPAVNESATSAFPRTIQDANGIVEITEAPKKVAVVHWGYLDSILLFDLPSVAFALPFSEQYSVLHTDIFQSYVDQLDELVIVGENTTVNLEALLVYEPDLIIAGGTMHAEISGELSKIAKTVFIDETQIDVWSDWPSLVRAFGEILGQEDIAEQYVSDFQANVQTAREKLADVEGNVAFVQVRADAVYLQGTQYLTQYYEGLGLKPLHNDKAQEGDLLTLEGLAALDPDHLFLGYFNYVNTSMAALTDEWEQTEVWKKLKAVQHGQVYAVNGELAMGYGPLSNAYGIQEVLKALE